MLTTLIAQALESAFNVWLKLDASTHGTALQRLQALNGKLIHLNLAHPTLSLYFLPTTTTVKVSTHYAAEPDVTISGSVLALMHVMQADDTGQAMLANSVKVVGDTGLGTQFSQILREVNIDWEELLSKAIGDSLAYQTGSQLRKGKTWISDTSQALRSNMQEYLQEEIRLTPSPAELQTYLNAIDTLRSDTDRLTARIIRLEQLQKP